MVKLGLYYRVLVHDKNGKLVKKTRWRKSKSFVIAFLQHMYSAMNNVNTYVIDTGNEAKLIQSPASAGGSTVGSYRFLSVAAGAGVDAYGIVVGTGTGAPTNSDYALGAKITTGTGAGQLSYGSHSFVAPAVVAGNVDLVISRTFNNASGATITVNEIGIYCLTVDTVYLGRYFCIVRDVLAAGVSVDNGQTLTVQYTLRTTV